MSAYKDYIDRISLDEEQHEKLLQAVREAETEKTVGENVRRGKTRRSPLKTMGIIASAAAVAIVLLALPSLFVKKTDASLTFAAEIPNEDVVIDQAATEYAVNTAGQYAAANRAEAAGPVEAPLGSGQAEEVNSEVLTYQLTADLIGKNGKAEAETAADGRKNENPSYVTAELTALPSGADLDRAIAEILNEAFLQMSETKKSDAFDYRFTYQNEVVCRYDSASGFLSADGKGTTLSAARREQLNMLLKAYFESK
ncbi:MAG: hypothetical protein IJK47_00435 [Lachnospiraceae bacterium]|nr:hypothetical protein [Lachnospiraceae bacterium]